MCVCFLPYWVFIVARGLSLDVVSGGYSLIVVHKRLIVVDSLVAEHSCELQKLQCVGLVAPQHVESS